ncbi:MAG: pitrilysin family protein, partial [Planctomycetota bacterium]|nr:pitrilysin family protein [Planctomycetota bacterium]
MTRPQIAPRAAWISAFVLLVSILAQGPAWAEEPSPASQPDTAGNAPPPAAGGTANEPGKTPAHAPLLTVPVEERSLSNGIRVITVERRGAPTIAACIAVGVGSCLEEPGKTGISHLLEHMMFKGTAMLGTTDYEKEKPILDRIDAWIERRDEERAKGDSADPAALERYRVELEFLQEEYAKLAIPNEYRLLYSKNGISMLNASTNRDVTRYYCSMPANVIELWLRAESERLLAPVFREFHTERDVVCEERRLVTETNAVGVLWEKLNLAAYTVHGYKWPVIGFMEDIARLGKRDIARHFEENYTPDRMVIAMVGHFRTEDLMKDLEKWFGRIPRRTAATPSIPEEPAESGERRVSVEFKAQPRLAIGYRATALGDRDGYALDVIAELLTGGNSSRLVKSLVIDKKMCSSISCGAPASRYPGQFSISASPVSPHTCAEIEAEVVFELG